MASPSLRRKVLLLLLCAALAAPWASMAASRKPAPTKAALAPLSLLARSWGFLTSLWGEEGCGIDPSGRCATVMSRPPAPKIDEGCGIDPDGRCSH
jgi:hypothetical protein